jgi:hypothetical protein
MVRQTGRLTCAVLTGCVFAALTWIMLEDTFRTSISYWLFFLVLPGTFLSMLSSGNVHGGSTWVATLGNFGLYSVLAYVFIGIWSKRSK